MRAPGLLSLALGLLLLAAACGAAGGRQEVRSEGAPIVLAVAAQPPVTTAPFPSTTDALGSATTTAAAPKEPPLPDGAHHGDQPEVVEHFGAIAADGDCDQLRLERDADRMARDSLLGQRDTDPAARGRAEMADRWMQAAQGRMRTLRCPVQSPMAETP